MYNKRYFYTMKINIADKITLVLAYLGAILALFIYLTSYENAKQYQYDRIERSLYQYSENFKETVDDYLSYNIETLSLLASMEEVNNMEWDSQYNFLNKKKELLNFEHFIVVDLEGNCYYTNRNEIKNQSDEQFFADVMDNDIYITDPFTEEIENRSITTLSVPIYNGDKRVGSLCGVIDLKKVYSSFENNSVGQSGYCFLINEKGDYIAHRNMEYVINSKNVFDQLNEDDRNFLLEGIDSEETINGEIIIDEDTYYAAITKLNLVNWELVVIIPTEEELIGINSFIKAQVISISIVFILLILSIKWVIQGFKNHKLAYTDSLTNLGNRAAIETVNNKLENDYKTNIGIISFDLNDFKYINDTYGHAKGDIVLVSFAKILKKVFSKNFIGRMGGDEFIVIIPNATPTIIEKKISEMDELIKLYNDSNDLKIKVSYGYAVRNKGKEESLEETYSTADKNMYLIKQSKKNKNV